MAETQGMGSGDGVRPLARKHSGLPASARARGLTPLPHQPRAQAGLDQLQGDAHRGRDGADTGEGIAPDRLPHIFDRFQTAAWHRPESADRTGLGLSIVKSVVELHGGSIAISSTPRVGTTVTLELLSAGGMAANPA